MLAAAIAALLARSMARRIAAPLNEFDLENPLSNDVYDELTPLLSVVPLQLFAYDVAKERGCNIDKPKNLAKSVTVE